jgi:hypothetical protein
MRRLVIVQFVAAIVITVAVAGCTGPARTEPDPSGTASSGGRLTALPSLVVSRAAHTATALPDGRVLVAGGCTSAGCEDTAAGGRAEIYDPRTRTFGAGPAMVTARAGHTATPLSDGRVLITGGYPGEGAAPLPTAELYDPATDRFVATGPMAVGRGAHTATLLSDGRVLLVGGWSGTAALVDVEIYDPRSGRFRPATPLPAPRSTHAAALLRDGRVLVVGGQSSQATLVDTALLYDPVRHVWDEVGRLGAAKYKLALAPLPDGGALVIGGQTRDDYDARLATTERYDARTGRFTPGPAMTEPRYKISDAVVTLPDGRVVIAGGTGVEVYTDGRLSRLTGGSGAVRLFPAAVALNDGTVLVTGGYDDRTRVTGTTLLANPG